MIIKLFPNGKIRTNQWQIEGVLLAHSQVEYEGETTYLGGNDRDTVRLHFGLGGDYDFHYRELGQSYSLRGDHNNMMYSDGIGLEILNKSSMIETFGVEFSKATFLEIAQHGNDSLKQLADRIAKNESTILSPHWRPNTFRMRQLIQSIIDCPFSGALKHLFLLSKSIELLVLQADCYERSPTQPFIKHTADKEKLFAAKAILEANLESPPTIRQLSQQIGMNDYKLKKGFKELFDTTVFGFIHQNRMQLAKQLLLDTDKTAKEIAYETGYSSPQHFSRAFKKEFNTTPNRMRKTPDNTIHRV